MKSQHVIQNEHANQNIGYKIVHVELEMRKIIKLKDEIKKKNVQKVIKIRTAYPNQAA